MTSNTLARSLTFTALAFALAACGGARDASESSSGESARSAATGSGQIPAAVGSSSLSEARLVDELVANLQACSYDGAPVRLAGVSSALPDECRDMVAQIMKFTGLPQNFKVVEARVPNAAAIIMLDEHKIPQRVIAFNRDFMNIVRAATDGNAWAPVSVMAHEIAITCPATRSRPGAASPRPNSKPTSSPASSSTRWAHLSMTRRQRWPNWSPTAPMARRTRAAAAAWERSTKAGPRPANNRVARPATAAAARWRSRPGCPHRPKRQP